MQASRICESGLVSGTLYNERWRQLYLGSSSMRRLVVAAPQTCTQAERIERPCMTHSLMHLIPIQKLPLFHSSRSWNEKKKEAANENNRNAKERATILKRTSCVCKSFHSVKGQALYNILYIPQGTSTK